jgi:hypothetical protein
MPINDETGTGAAPISMPSGEPRVENRGAQPFSFHTGGLFAAPISRGVGSEFYSKLKTNLTEVYKQAHEDTEIALIDLDNINEPALAFSAIIVAIRFKRQANLGVAYHVLLLEATGDKLLPRQETINGQPVESLLVTSDALDDVLMTKAHEKVRRAFPTGPWFNVDGVVVPASFNPDDKYAVHHLALNAGLACSTELSIREPGFADLNLANMANDSSLNVNIGFNRTQIADAVGTPMRSDILINFASKKQGSQNKFTSVNSGDKEVKVSEVSGYLDLVWNPVATGGVYNPYVQQLQTQTQKYAARLVITNLASNYSYTPASVLLAMTTALSLRDDNNWIQQFRPTPSKGNEIDMTDIGALNIESNLMNEPNGFGTRIDTKADSFKLEDLGQLVAALIQPGLIISLDCPEAGAQSWHLSVFAAASNGSSAAYRVIYDAANQLTNGAFAKHFPQGSSMFVDQNNRVHLGTWTDRNGNKRDIRDIDHIAVCNLTGERNPQVIRDWSDTFLRTQFPLVQRLAARKRMISGLTNETAVFTGFAQRITFSAAFMDALSKGIRETGMAVRINTPLSGSDFNNQRGVAGFAGAALLAPGQTFMQAAGYGGYANQYAPNAGYGTHRW